MMISDTVNAFKLMKKQLQVYLFQIFLVDGVEGVIVGAVYVEDGDDLAVPADRDDYLAF